jgi:hypothetical protein
LKNIYETIGFARSQRSYVRAILPHSVRDLSLCQNPVLQVTGPSNLTQMEESMGILEEAAGAFAAVEGVKKLDPDAGVITEGVAAIAGFEGTKAVTDFIEKKEEEKQENQG